MASFTKRSEGGKGKVASAIPTPKRASGQLSNIGVRRASRLSTSSEYSVMSPSPSNPAIDEFNTGLHAATYGVQSPARESSDVLPCKHDESSRHGTQTGAANDEDAKQASYEHDQEQQTGRPSTPILESGVMTANALGEMYASCLSPHPATLGLSPEPPQPAARRGITNPGKIRPSTERPSYLPFGRETSSLQAKRGFSTSTAPFLRLLFTKQAGGSNSKLRQRGPNGELINISRPMPCPQLDLLQSSTPPYEDLVDEGLPPIAVRTATNPCVVDTSTAPIEALPRTSVQLSQPNSRKTSQGSGSGTWSLLRTFSTKGERRPRKTSRKHGASDDDLSRKNAFRDQLLDAQAQRQLAHEASFNGYAAALARASVETQTPPQRPPRPESLYASAAVQPEASNGDKRISEFSTREFSSQSSSAEGDEEARVQRHRQRAYEALEGVTESQPQKDAITFSAWKAEMAAKARASSATSYRSKVSKLPKRMSEREMLALHQAEQEKRSGSSSPSNPASSASSVLDTPIVSAHRSDRAWWEGSPEKPELCTSLASEVPSDVERSESPPLKLRMRDVKGKGKAIDARPANLARAAQSSSLGPRQSRLPLLRQNADSPQTPSKSVPRSFTQDEKRILRSNSLGRSIPRATKSGKLDMPPLNDQASISSDSEQSTDSPEDRENVHVSSSDSSLEAKATALRHGKALNGLNEYEAAHAIGRVPSAALSQLSLGLTEDQKTAMKPEPLRKVTRQSTQFALSEIRRLQEVVEGLQQQISRTHRVSRSESDLHRLTATPSPPPIPARSSQRPPLNADWSSYDEVNALPQIEPPDRSSDEDLPARFQPSNLSTITEEPTNLPSSPERPPHDRTPTKPAAASCTPLESSDGPGPAVTNSPDSDSAVSENLHDEHWWSDDDNEPLQQHHTNSTPDSKGAGAASSTQATSSKNTTPEKDTFFDIDSANKEPPPAAEQPPQTTEQDILSYYLNKPKPTSKHSPQERMQRELRRRAVAEEAARPEREREERERCEREARDSEERRVEEERLARVRGVMRGLRSPESWGGWREGD